MRIISSGRIVLWQGGSLWLFDTPPAGAGDRRKTDAHSHHAIQLTFSLGGRFALETAERRVGSPGAAVAPDASHVFEAEGPVGLLFVEPESRAGRALTRALFQENALVPVDTQAFADISDRITAIWRSPTRNDPELIGAGQEIVSRIAGGLGSEPLDWRIRKAITWASDQLEQQVQAADAAKLVGLSPGRFSHLFAEHTGLPFRTYLLWLRLGRAVESFAAGERLTQAAHKAGFADSAHFSRTFHRMFGIPAAALQIA
jgi:AraC-like DNA-binding protein